LHARVAHKPFVGGIAFLSRRIFEPGEDDLFLRLCVDGLAEVGDLAFGDVAVPGLDHPANADFLNDRRELTRVLFVSGLVALRDRYDESFEVSHAAAPSGSG